MRGFSPSIHLRFSARNICNLFSAGTTEAARRPLPSRLFRPKWHHLLHFARGTRGARRRARRPPHHRNQRQFRRRRRSRKDRLRSRQFSRRDSDENDAHVNFQIAHRSGDAPVYLKRRRWKRRRWKSLWWFLVVVADVSMF